MGNHILGCRGLLLGVLRCARWIRDSKVFARSQGWRGAPLERSEGGGIPGLTVSLAWVAAAAEEADLVAAAERVEGGCDEIVELGKGGKAINRRIREPDGGFWGDSLSCN